MEQNAKAMIPDIDYKIGKLKAKQVAVNKLKIKLKTIAKDIKKLEDKLEIVKQDKKENIIKQIQNKYLELGKTSKKLEITIATIKENKKALIKNIKLQNIIITGV